jgi:hypothetical protein
MQCATVRPYEQAWTGHRTGETTLGTDPAVCLYMIRAIGEKVVDTIDQALLRRRFDLRKTQYLCERLDKSPNITERCLVAPHLGISHAPSDVSILPSVCDVFLEAYEYVKDWFGCRGDLAIDLWMAPEVVDLEYMTCMPCGDGYMCAPGTRSGANIIPFVSPLTSAKNADRDRFSAVLAHEITHHFVTDISRATIFSMKRKENFDVPLWLEEGLCQMISSEVNPSFRAKWAGEIAGTSTWYPLEDLWNDLSGCGDATRGYLQAYKETRAVVERKGKGEIIRLLYLNRTHYVDWNGLPYEGEASVKVRYANDRQT